MGAAGGDKVMDMALQASADAKLALAQIALHEAMCAQRYMGLEGRIAELSASLKTILGGSWRVAMGIIGLLTTAVGGLVFFLLTAAHH